MYVVEGAVDVVFNTTPHLCQAVYSHLPTNMQSMVDFGELQLIRPLLLPLLGKVLFLSFPAVVISCFGISSRTK